MRLSKYIYLLTIGFLNIKSMESNSRKYCSKDDTYCNYTRLSTGLNEDTIEISMNFDDLPEAKKSIYTLKIYSCQVFF